MKTVCDEQDYDREARAVLKECGGEITWQLWNTKVPPWESKTKVGEHHPHYRVTLTGPGGQCTFDFWDSIDHGNKGLQPTAYDILTCIEWFDCGTFEEFCREYGYDTDSRKAEKVWLAVQTQARDVSRIFPTESREKLSQIQ